MTLKEISRNLFLLIFSRNLNVLLPDESNKIMFSDTGKQSILLPGKSNNIMFSETGKQNVLLPDESNKIMFSDT